MRLNNNENRRIYLGRFTIISIIEILDGDKVRETIFNPRQIVNGEVNVKNILPCNAIYCCLTNDYVVVKTKTVETREGVVNNVTIAKTGHNVVC